jgi:hypothetical protein
LPEESILSDEFLRQLVSVGEVDLLIGVPTYNNAATAGQVARSLEQALLQSFARDRVVVVNADGGSRDGTPEALIHPPIESHNRQGLIHLRTIHRLTTRYRGQPSFASAMRTIVAAAELLGAKACAILAPTSSNVTPAWIENLIRPTYKESFDYVAPLYNRHKYDGLLIREILYPVGRATYGWRIRELHAEECGFSGKLASHCVNERAWDQEGMRLSPTNWMAVAAMSTGLRVCQSYLGPKARAPIPTAGEVVSAIGQAVGALFWCLDAKPSLWMERAGSESVPTFGSDHELTDAPLRANRKRLQELFRTGVNELSPILSQVLRQETLERVQGVATLEEEKFDLDDGLWAHILYDFAAAYHCSALNRDHLLQALTPLYRGRVCAFLKRHRHSSPERIEQGMEELCLEFERQKPYLLERWKAAK